MKKILAILLLLCLLPAAALAEAQSTDDILREMITAYGDGRDAAADTVSSLLDALGEADPAQEKQWRHIMSYWAGINHLPINYDTLPGYLSQTDDLCLVVLGFQLNADGTMKPELEDRLQVALRCAQQYPNAYVLCTGGGTAKKNKNATEAEVMAEWLAAQGLAEDRILCEAESKSTVENAVFSCRLLKESYPGVTSLVIITSDYHITTGCLLFETEGVLSAGDAAPVRVIAHAACRGDTDYPFDRQTNGLMSLAGLTQ